jgi:hypothetical protein
MRDMNLGHYRPSRRCERHRRGVESVVLRLDNDDAGRKREDAYRTVATRAGYSPDAVGRTVRARFWEDGRIERTRQPARSHSMEPEW